MRFSVLNFINIKQSSSKKKNICREEKVIIWINVNPVLALAGFQTILPGFKQVNRTWARDPIEKPSFAQRSTSEKHVTSISCKLEPAIWSHDTGQQIPYFNKCQLIITWMSDIKEVHGKPKLHVSVNLLLEYGRHVARLHRRRCRRRRRRRRAYAPTSNTASHGAHEKINSWVPFSSLIWVWGSAWRPSAAGAPL